MQTLKEKSERLKEIAAELRLINEDIFDLNVDMWVSSSASYAALSSKRLSDLYQEIMDDIIESVNGL